MRLTHAILHCDLADPFKVEHTYQFSKTCHMLQEINGCNIYIFHSQQISKSFFLPSICIFMYLSHFVKLTHHFPVPRPKPGLGPISEPGPSCSLTILLSRTRCAQMGLEIVSCYYVNSLQGPLLTLQPPSHSGTSSQFESRNPNFKYFITPTEYLEFFVS